MKTILSVALLLSFALLGTTGCASAADANGTGQWQSLFNGKDLSGWAHENGGTFFVTNGLIHMEGGQGWLRTDKEFTDFILEVEWRGLEPNFNSGIFVRAPLEGNPWATNVWQINLKQTAVGEVLAGSRKAVLSTTKRPVGEWVSYRVEARGKKLTLFVDGERAWDYDEFDPARGYIGLQAEGRAIDFRNIRVQELAPESAPK